MIPIHIRLHGPETTRRFWGAFGAVVSTMPPYSAAPMSHRPPTIEELSEYGGSPCGNANPLLIHVVRPVGIPVLVPALIAREPTARWKSLPVVFTKLGSMHMSLSFPTPSLSTSAATVICAQVDDLPLKVAAGPLYEEEPGKTRLFWNLFVALLTFQLTTLWFTELNRILLRTMFPATALPPAKSAAWPLSGSTTVLLKTRLLLTDPASNSIAP